MPYLDVGTKHPDYEKFAGQFQKARDFGDGEESVKERGVTYLPKLSGHESEADQLYRDYKSGAEVFEAVPKVVEAFVSMVFRKEPTQEDGGNETVATLLENIDGCGNTLTEYLTALAVDVVNPGRAGTLVEAPRDAAGGLSEAQAELLGVRPYAVPYSAESIWNWDVSRLHGSARKELLEVHLHEDHDPNLEGAITTETAAAEGQIRVLSLASVTNSETGTKTRVYTQQVYQRDGASAEVWTPLSAPEPIQIANTTINYIPFYFANWADTTPTARRPLLMGMVNISNHHYRQSADLNNGLAYCGRPQPVIYNHEANGADPDTGEMGAEPQELKIGQAEAWMLYGQDVRAEYLEFHGQGLGALQEKLDRLESKLALLGARHLAPEKRAAEAAETARIHRMGEHGTLGRLAGVLQGHGTDIVTTALEWMQVDPSSFSYEIDRNFFPMSVDAQTLRTMFEGQTRGVVDLADIHALLVAAELRDAERDLDDVIENIERERASAGTGAGPDDFVELPEG